MQFRLILLARLDAANRVDGYRRNEAKIGLLERQYDELVQKYEDRESRPEDLERLAEMEERLRRAEEEVVRVEDEMKYFKMELRNREQNFNQVFGGGAPPHPTHFLCLADRVPIPCPRVLSCGSCGPPCSWLDVLVRWWRQGRTWA